MDDYKIIVEQDNSTVVGRYETPKRTQKEPSLLCYDSLFNAQTARNSQTFCTFAPVITKFIAL